MRFEVYFTISEVASRLAKARNTVARLALAGELGPVYRVAGELTVTESGLCAFLVRCQVNLREHAAAAEVRRAAMERRLGRKEQPPRRPFVDGVAARSEGELRRKMSEVGQ